MHPNPYIQWTTKLRATCSKVDVGFRTTAAGGV